MENKIIAQIKLVGKYKELYQLLNNKTEFFKAALIKLSQDDEMRKIFFSNPAKALKIIKELDEIDEQTKEDKNITQTKEETREDESIKSSHRISNW